jgi:hypothetical protein
MCSFWPPELDVTPNVSLDDDDNDVDV